MVSTCLIEFLVPLGDNEGTPFLDSSFATFERILVDLAGGFTRRGDVEGAWKSPEGTTYRDRSRYYTVQVAEPDAPIVAASIDTEIRRRFRQLATFIIISKTQALAS